MEEEPSEESEEEKNDSEDDEDYKDEGGEEGEEDEEDEDEEDGEIELPSINVVEKSERKATYVIEKRTPQDGPLAGWTREDRVCPRRVWKFGRKVYNMLLNW